MPIVVGIAAALWILLALAVIGAVLLGTLVLSMTGDMLHRFRHRRAGSTWACTPLHAYDRDSKIEIPMLWKTGSRMAGLTRLQRRPRPGGGHLADPLLRRWSWTEVTRPARPPLLSSASLRSTPPRTTRYGRFTRTTPLIGRTSLMTARGAGTKRFDVAREPFPGRGVQPPSRLG